MSIRIEETLNNLGIVRRNRLCENSSGVGSFFSFFFFFSFSYVWSGGIVLLGIFLNVYSKNEKQINAWIAQQRSKYLTQRQKRTLLMENV